jgi:thiol-disulfide isomerase/thioredoxin
MKGATPTAPSWNTPTDPGYNYKTETSGLLAGYVLDPDGRKLGGVYVAVREVGDSNPKDIGVVSLPDGAFVIQGLKSGRNYMLTVNTTSGDRKVFGVVYAKTPNPNVRITLLEGELAGGPPSVKPVASIDGGKTGTSDDPLKRRPTPSHSIPAPRTTVPDGPLPVPEFGARPRSRSDLPTPQPLDRETGLHPTGGYEVPPASGPAPERYDLMTDQGPLPWKAPAAAIPTPRAANPIAPAPFSERSESRKSETYTLVNTQGRGANLPQAKLVLLQFFTTASVTCQRVVPTLNGVQERYAARGVEVVGLVCDDASLKARVMAADQFRSDFRVGYTVLTEPGKRPGDWMTRFGVAELPTAVLLDQTGAVLWQGNPAQTDEMIRAIESGLRTK